MYLGESYFSESWFKVKQVIDIFNFEPTFVPIIDDWVELNPTGDKIKIRILRVERCWEWRSRVSSALRCQCQLYDWEIKWRRRYLTLVEAQHFWTYYINGRPWREEVGRAISKVDRNFEKKGVYW